MSPIPSVATAFALSPVTRSVTLDPDSDGQPASVAPHNLLGTGSLLFAVVAIVSVAGYFFRKRGAANNFRTSNTWSSLSNLLLSMRHRGSPRTSTAAATDWPIDLEVGPGHVSMVYARFFHPTFWNLVECHPATPSAPAICVEDEANEISLSDPKLPGMNSFLDMDDDHDCNDGSPERACEKPDRNVRFRAEEFPPYDTSLPINVKFNSEIIGTTVRPGEFLSVPEELENRSSQKSSCNSLSVAEEPDANLSENSSDFEPDVSCSAYDGISTSLPRSSPNASRHCMAEVPRVADGLNDTVPDEDYGLAPTISFRTGLFDISKFLETDTAMSCKSPERTEPMDDKPSSSNCDIDIHDCRDGLRNSWSDTDTLAAPHEGLQLMRRLLAELRDPQLNSSPRALSEDSHSEYDEDDEATIPYLTPTCHLDSARQHSLESTSSTPRTDGSTSEEGPIYPLTLSPKLANYAIDVSDDIKARMAPPVPLWSNEEVQIMSPMSSNSPPSFPSKVYIRTHSDSRSLLYAPRLPLVSLPRL